MVRDHEGSRGPPDVRRELAEALAIAAVGNAGPVPFLYLIDLLARRYGVPPWEIRDAPYEDVMRAIHFMNVEAQARAHG